MGCIVDASIVVAYQRIGRLDILRLYSSSVQVLHVSTPMLNDELPNLSLTQRGFFKSLEPTLDQVFAASLSRGPLSSYDHLCLVLARDHSFSLMTNDSPLVEHARREGIEVIRNPGLLKVMVDSNLLTPVEAADVANLIHEDDPRQIGARVLHRFIIELGV